MKPYLATLWVIFFIPFIFTGCKRNMKEQQDKVYSRHLQRYVDLTIISTPVPDDKNNFNLLLLNDGQDAAQFDIKHVTDSLYKKKLLQPLVIVAIHAANREHEYGVSGLPDFNNNGDKADKYSAFVDNELYPFVKKKTGVRKFKSVAIAGCSLGGLSAFDIAWDNADKIDKVGVFSGSFWWRDKHAKAADYSDAANRILLNKISASRKKPKLTYWLYAGAAEEKSDRDKDGIPDVVDDTRDLVNIIRSKKLGPPEAVVYTEIPDGKHDYNSWKRALPAFLVWAFHP